MSAQAPPLLRPYRAIELHASDDVSHRFQGLQGRRIDLEGQHGDRCVPPDHGGMRLGQAREHRLLGPIYRGGALGLVAGLGHLKHDEYTGATRADLRPHVGIDEDIGLRRAGSERRAAHDLGEENGQDPRARGREVMRMHGQYCTSSPARVNSGGNGGYWRRLFAVFSRTSTAAQSFGTRLNISCSRFSISE